MGRPEKIDPTLRRKSGLLRSEVLRSIHQDPSSQPVDHCQVDHCHAQFAGQVVVAAARTALEAAGIRVLEARDVLVQRLNQTEPGQLGKISRRMAEAGVNIEVLYSDHDHQLILVVDDIAKGQEVSEAWTRESLDERRNT